MAKVTCPICQYGWEIIFIEGTHLTEEAILTSLRGGGKNF